MDIHAYSQLWMTPWGYKKAYPDDNGEQVGTFVDLFLDICFRFVEHCLFFRCALARLQRRRSGMPDMAHNITSDPLPSLFVSSGKNW